jgi:FMN phosphatase YigB (HAD superfamily)
LTRPAAISRLVRSARALAAPTPFLGPRRIPADRLGAELARRHPDLVLVDCFGTLLHRSVPSGRVQARAASDLTDVFGGTVDAATILSVRKAAERQLGATGDASRRRDVPLPELARAVRTALAELDQREEGVADEEAFVSLFCAIELAAEVSSTMPNAEIVELLRARTGSSRCVVISDTNLTEPMLLALLRAHGIEDLADRVVVSSDAGATKRSGELYAMTLAAEGVDPSRAVMIGDHPVGDRQRATDAGLASFLVAGGRWDATKEASDPELRRDIERRLARVLRPRAGEPFPELSLTLWLFTARLDAALRAAGAERAVFLAREGAFLKELFDRQQQHRARPGRDPLSTSYLLTSRRSTSSPEPDQRDAVRALVADVLPPSRRLHLVDVGWKGTVQDRLTELVPDADITGHYLGLIAAPGVVTRAKVGHLFTNDPARSPYYQVFSHFKELYELLLAAEHGSVARYGRGADGAVVAELDESAEERRCFDELVGPFQAALLDRFDEVLGVLGAVPDLPAWTTDLVARHHARMMYRPRRVELDFVDGLVQYDNYGTGRLKATGDRSSGDAPRGLRRNVSGGGWPPLRMRRAGAGWQRLQSAVVKTAQLHTGRLR